MRGRHKHKWDSLRQVLAEKIVYDDNNIRVWMAPDGSGHGLLYYAKQAQVSIQQGGGEEGGGQGQDLMPAHEGCSAQGAGDYDGVLLLPGALLGHSTLAQPVLASVDFSKLGQTKQCVVLSIHLYTPH